jgi:hypothetical protein|tara:strand:- start:1043 stop:1801 length:759 start_codon:yes stop_codon:yes gene_type:complete
MASTYSQDLSLELVATGEKAGLWGSITNTNLQILETATAFKAVAIVSTAQTLSLADGSATADGKYLYLKLTGTLTGNTTLTMPAATSAGNATRIFIIEDATNRATNLFTLSVLTTGQGTALPIPQGANMLLVSNGGTPATTLGGFLKKGVVSIVSSARTTYTAVAGDQIMVDTNTDIVTITFPSSPSSLDEITIMDATGTNGFATNKCTVNFNGLKYNGATTALDLTTNNQSVTFIYTNTANKGWIQKSNNT